MWSQRPAGSGTSPAFGTRCLNSRDCGFAEGDQVPAASGRRTRRLGAALHRVPALAPGADSLADVDDVVEPGALEDRGGEAAALAAAADRRDRAVARQLVAALGQVAIGDVGGVGDVLAGVLGGVADI